MTPQQVQKALNALLPQDISVLEAKNIRANFHAQYSAKQKIYRYTILNRDYRSAFWRDRAYFYPHKLNLAEMQKVANKLKGTHDFKPFQSAAQRSRIKNTVRTIKDLSIVKEGDLVHISITADGFLYKMVRNITGALIAAGSGQRVSKTAPSHGLCLMSVRY